MNTLNSKILIEIRRNSLIEREHSGFIVLVDNEGKTLFENSSNKQFFLRSCAKPFQALPILLSGAYEKFGFDLNNLAICCGSHAGTDRHVKQVKNILEKIGLDESYLQCGIHAPFDATANNNLVKNGIHPSQVHNNCSGKHAGMLAVCLANNWSIKNYLDLNHPLQQQIIEITGQLCKITDEMPMTSDGCGTPICGMSLDKMGTGFLNIFKTDAGKIIKEAMTNNPFLIGNAKNLDTALIEVTKGRLIAKVGAEGLCIVANTPLQQALVVKIQDGDKKARNITVIEALRQLKWLSQDELNHNDIKQLFDLEIKTLAGQTVGSINPVFTID